MEGKKKIKITVSKVHIFFFHKEPFKKGYRVATFYFFEKVLLLHKSSIQSVWRDIECAGGCAHPP